MSKEEQERVKKAIAEAKSSVVPSSLSASGLRAPSAGERSEMVWRLPASTELVRV